MTTFTLTTAKDIFAGGAGADTFSGPAGGNDTLKGAGGADTFTLEDSQAGKVNGGAGFDTVIANGTDLGTVAFQGVEHLTAANDTLHATALQFNAFASMDTTSSNPLGEVFVITGDGGIVDFTGRWTGPALTISGALSTTAITITGTEFSDQIVGSSFADILNGGAGDDGMAGYGPGSTVNGGDGDDDLNLYGNAEFAYGGIGADSILGFANDLTLNGDDGDDAITSSGSETIMYGGEGADVLTANSSNDVAHGGFGNDGLIATVSSTGAILDGEDGNDTLVDYGSGTILNGLDGNDQIDISGASTATVDGGAGTDTVLAFNSDMGTATFANVEILSLAVDEIAGTFEQFNSFASMTADAEAFVSLVGTGGTISFATKWTSNAILFIDANPLSSGATVTGSNNGSTIGGTNYNDFLYGGAGDDTISGALGADVISGGGGNDTLTAEDDGTIVYGDGGDDVIVDTSAFSTMLRGNAGNDTLTGGAHGDQLAGGAGADTFVYSAGSDSNSTAYDRIGDFTSLSDHIDLWFAVAAVDSTVSATKLGKLGTVLDAGTFAVGHAVLANIGSHTYLVVNSDGAAGYQAGSDLLIRVDGVTNIDVGDFT